MREILFRAKTCNGEWVEGLLANKGNKWYISNKAGQPFAFEVRPDTICQYTGLCDKNGRKIWENDIVSFVHSKITQELLADTLGFPDFGRVEYKRNYAIEFVNTYNSYGLRFRNKSVHFPCKRSTIVMHDAEVIGNLFDNPELLEDN